jgi:16S rRNA (guanine527-N7)-methyltransferase
VEIILKYFPSLTSKQQAQFSALASLYKEWNEKINVISRKDMDHLYERHVLHSLGIAKVISFKDQTSILDVGTGGGFPGIPLAILFPECQFHLVDSIGKKIKVVQEVSDAIELTNIKAEQARAEHLQEQYDFVVSRAVTDIKEFYGWIRNKFLKGGHNSLDNGILYLKGGDLTEELKELKRPYKVFDLKEYFQEEFFDTKKVLYVKG